MFAPQDNDSSPFGAAVAIRGGVIAIGAVLVYRQELSFGLMVAAMIFSGRAVGIVINTCSFLMQLTEASRAKQDLNDIFAQVHDIATYPILTYVNSDIILTSDFIPTVQSVPIFQVVRLFAQCL